MCFLLLFLLSSCSTIRSDARGTCDAGLNSYVLPGDVLVCNTLEDFKCRDKQSLIQASAQKVRVFLILPLTI